MSVAELSREVRAEQALNRALEKHAGQWVAVRSHEIVGHADNLKGLLEQIDTKEVEAVFQVPEDKSIACFF